MIKYAITGNIASGKSQVEKVLVENNFIVFDADKLAHDILVQDSTVRDAFKDYDVLENGLLSRTKLGRLVFNNASLRKKLEDIVHPLVKKRILELFEEYKNEKYIFISIPLLFETGMNDMFDKIILVSIDRKIQLQRLINRNNLSEDDALSRINAQMLEDTKLTKSDYIIENNSTIEEFMSMINKFVSGLN